MEMKIVFALLLSVVALCEAGHWDYESHGPKTWGDKCGGKAQSPINLDLKKVKKGGMKSRVFNHNYWNDIEGTYTIKNNGHALQIDLPADHDFILKKGKKSYVPLQIHIHFDPVTGKGSEHKVNGKKYFAEIHIVHRNSKYTEKKDIMGNSDGLFVIGMFVDRVKGKNNPAGDLDFLFPNDGSKTRVPNKRTSFAMQAFAAGAANKKEGQNKQIPAFPLAWLLPRIPVPGVEIDYVNYKGSLTTPPCSEIVDWVVITGRKLEISRKTANLFKAVKNSNKTPMAGNNRPVQPLNGRKLFAVKEMF